MKLTENQVKTIKVNYSDLLHRTSTIDFFSVSFIQIMKKHTTLQNRVSQE